MLPLTLQLPLFMEWVSIHLYPPGHGWVYSLLLLGALVNIVPCIYKYRCLLVVSSELYNLIIDIQTKKKISKERIHIYVVCTVTLTNNIKSGCGKRNVNGHARL